MISHANVVNDYMHPYLIIFDASVALPELNYFLSLRAGHEIAECSFSKRTDRNYQGINVINYGGTLIFINLHWISTDICIYVLSQSKLRKG